MINLACIRWKPSFFKAAAAVVCAGLSTLAMAAGYPDKPITLVVPFPPGGSTDVQARLIAKGVSAELGQPVVVENRAGAAGAIGTRHVAGAAPDGYTLLFASISSLVTEPILNKSVGFDPLRDFVPVSIISDIPFLLVVECSSPAKSVDDLIRMAREQPGKLNYSSWGYGSSGNLLAEMFKRSANVNITHIPYKGEAPAVMGLLSKEVSTMFVTPVNMPYIRNGQMCPLAVTGSKRLDVLPNTPTFKESGLDDMNLQIWFGIVAPAKTPEAVTQRLQQALVKVVQTPEFKKAAEPMGVIGIGSSSSAFQQRIEEDMASIANLAKDATLRQ
ncbi:MAG TPA: tripartite tricarboxylate transporter substrate binding protein [Bordetella sp.]|nr:tripartite tricarboxylate transporter substrate binding protein [Bordetella sp.]